MERNLKEVFREAAQLPERDRAAGARVADLIFQEETEGLPDEEKSELDHSLLIEHVMRLAKARAHHYLANGLMD